MCMLGVRHVACVNRFCFAHGFIAGNCLITKVYILLRGI